MTPAANPQLLEHSSAQAYVPNLAADYPRRSLSKNELLYHAGDVADTLYRVEEGLLKLSIDLITGKERIISLAGPGDFIGALTPAHQSYQESCEALSPRVSVTSIPAHDLSDHLQTEVFTATGVYLSRFMDTLEDSDLPVTARLARTLVRLGERFGTISENQTVHLTLPLTHDNFAAMVGAARETTTALLSEMRDEGLITGTRGRYCFKLDVMSDFATASS